MDTDSVQSYNQVTQAGAGGDGVVSRRGGERLPKDVLEAMEAGDLEKALLLLRVGDGQKEPGLLGQLLALFPQISFKKIKGKKAEQTVLKRAPLTQKKAEAKVRDQPRMLKESSELYSAFKQILSLPKQIASSLKGGGEATIAFIKQNGGIQTTHFVQEQLRRAGELFKFIDKKGEQATAALSNLYSALEEKITRTTKKVAEKIDKATEPVRKVVQERVNDLKEVLVAQAQLVQQVTVQAIAFLHPPLQAMQTRAKRISAKVTKVANRVRFPLLKVKGWAEKKMKRVLGLYHAALVTLGGALHRQLLSFWKWLLKQFWRLYTILHGILRAIYFVLRKTPPFIWWLLKSLFRAKKKRKALSPRK